MDFREALVFLSDQVGAHLSPDLLIRTADALVEATQPLTLEVLTAQVFDPAKHTERKIMFIKDLRLAASEAGLASGLVECKNAVEAHYLTLLKEKLVSPDPWGAFPD